LTTALNRKDIIGSLIIALIYITLQLVLFPYFDTFVGDDWSYVKAFDSFIGGELKFTGWTSMPLVGQLLMAYPFSFFTENTILATRISSQFYSLLFLIIIYLNLPDRNKILIAGILFNIFFLSFYNFLTEAYFIGVFTIALISATRRKYFLSILLFLLATSIRDITVVFLPIMGIIYYSNEKNARAALIYSVIISFIWLIFILGFRHILEISSGGLPELYDLGRERLFTTISKGPVSVILTSGKNIILGLGILGLYLIPVFLIMKTKLSGKFFTFLIVIFLVMMYLLPAQENGEVSEYMLAFFNLVTLSKGNLALSALHIPWLMNSVIALLLSIGFYSLTSIVWEVFRKQWRNRSGLISLVTDNPLWLGVVMYVLVLAPAGIFQRYMIVPLFLIVVDLGYRELEIRKLNKKGILVYSGLLVFGLHSILVNKALVEIRYAYSELIEIAESSGIGPENLDAGFEYNGYHNYLPEYSGYVQGAWWAFDNAYAISPYPAEGYEVLTKVTAYSYIPHSTDIYLSARK